MTPHPTFSVHLLVVQQDTHVHLTLFMGQASSERARCGELVMLKEEFFVLLEALRSHPQVEEVTITYKNRTAASLQEEPDCLCAHAIKNWDGVTHDKRCQFYREDDLNDRKGSY